LEQTRKALGSDYQPSTADDVVTKFVKELDRLGKKSGKGFYDYPEGGKKHLWPGLEEHYPRAENQPSVEEVKKRLLYRQAIETVRCMDEGVVTHPADADIGSIFGWGFPPYTGGTISYIETEGLKNFVAEADRLTETYGDRFTVPDSLRSMAEKGETFYQRADAGSRRSAA
jgi:3-hydroxyacyl-CoA dehydrogenase/enoyl-CoA hydratase/3-hydroxybutyryl-CoA epimerase